VDAIARHLLPDHAEISAGGRLSIGGRDLVELAEEFGTPLFVYDEAHLRARCRDTVAEFGDGACYAAKAFLCKAMARLAHEEGMRVDVATGGELHVSLSAGVPAGRLVLHGNNKSVEELATAVESGIGRIVIDSHDEVDRLRTLVEAGAGPIDVLLRITPGVQAHTHEYIATGHDDSKFGFTVSSGAAAAAVDRVLSTPGLVLRGLHCHIGSQVLRVDSFAEAMRVVAAVAEPFDLPELVVGGGLGVAYTSDERSPTLREWAAVIKKAAQDAGVTAVLSVEPGRAIVATAAVTLYTVGTIKSLPGIRTYVAVDGGMSDNPRPVMYGSRYEVFLPRATESPRPWPIRLVGKHCESGDVLVRDGWVPDDTTVGDIVATPVTGAYGHAMGSNYNKVPRPAAVFVADGAARLVIRRETIGDLLATDVG
jgi:diaminopimelate decarboxylase